MNTKTDFRFGEVYTLADQVEKTNEKVKFINILETSNGGVSLLAFEAGQYLDEHVAPAEVMVNVLEGEIEFDMAGIVHAIKAGEFLLMGQDVLHKVRAIRDSKVLLIKVKA